MRDDSPSVDLGSDTQEGTERVRFSESGYRIGKLSDRILCLRESLKNYINNGRHTKDIEKVEVGQLFCRVENLLSRMDDYDFSDEEKNCIVDMLAEVEELKKDFHVVVLVPHSTEEQREWFGNLHRFKNTFGHRLDDIQSTLDRLPKDRESELRFENGHVGKLAQALSKKDIDEAEKVVLEIDRLLMDDYAEFPKTIRGSTLLKFRLEQILNPKQPSFHTIDLTTGSDIRKARLVFNRREIDRGSGIYEFEISAQDLDVDQRDVWKVIK